MPESDPPLPPVPDDLFAQHLGKMGGASAEQLAAAKEWQSAQDKDGVVLSLADVLVQQGIITEAMRENVEKKVHLVKLGGHSQLGQYKLIKKLGEGGMGAVYLAENDTGTKVALKVLPEKHSSDPEFVTRFKREARATSKLHHANIVSASEIGEEAGTYFYAMEYCEGESLDGKLARAVFLPWEQAVEITLQVAHGLQCAHEHGFVHRDIKPANIFITKDGLAKVLDLGLTKNIADTEQSFNTMSGIALGTPHYISPEQAKGSREIDGRSDIYSLGATLYQLITGRTPFDGNTAALIMMKHLSEELPSPQDLRDGIPDGVVQIIQKMMAKEPDDRYDNCAGLIDDLKLALAGKSPSNVSLGAGKSSVAMRASRQILAAAAAAHMPTLVRQPSASAPAANPANQSTQSAASVHKPKNMLFMFAGAACFAAVLVAILYFGSKKDTVATTAPVQNPPSATAVKSTIPAAPVAATMVEDAWINQTRSATGDKQIGEVFMKLKSMNPAFSGQWRYIKNNSGEVYAVNFPAGSGVTNVSPVLAFPKLEVLAFDFEPGRDKAILLALKTLKQVNGAPVEEVLKRETPMPSAAPVSPPAQVSPASPETRNTENSGGGGESGGGNQVKRFFGIK